VDHPCLACLEAVGLLPLQAVEQRAQAGQLAMQPHRGAPHGGEPLRLAAGRIAQRLDSLDQEEITALTAEETNRHLYVLSILTTLFLPPTLVTGVFGMNTKGLPFTDSESAFLWASALMVASALAVYLLMRRVGVFKL
jgi:zinc transporter